MKLYILTHLFVAYILYINFVCDVQKFQYIYIYIYWHIHILRDDTSIIIKEADRGSGVAVWDREDYLKEAEKQLSSIIIWSC